ncbi:hypothetical protein, partial [Klebsiella pneumoniae]|uniref:hypothetical protein n=1 Tax=Klebsiella pneumoniae TaxID=573 RepID=UPI0025A0E7D6
SDHFGEDAGLPEPARLHIADYFRTHSLDQGPATPMRITEQPWFRAEHRWTGRSLGTRRISDCKVCHSGAEDGEFDD